MATQYFTPPTDAKRSWWADTPRDGFTDVARAQMPRMLRNRESGWVIGVAQDRASLSSAKSHVVAISWPTT